MEVAAGEDRRRELFDLGSSPVGEETSRCVSLVLCIFTFSLGMLLGEAAELSGWGPEGALDPGRVGTSPGPPSLVGCLTHVTLVCLAPGLHVGSFQQRCADEARPDEVGAEGWAWGVRPWRMTGAVGSGAGLASDTAGTSAFPYVYSLSSSTVFKARAGVGFGLVPGARQRSSVWARVPGCGPGSAL